MSLPKISLPLYEIKIPSNGKTIKFRPFTVKENRILLLASESQSTEQIVLATKQIISLCVQDDIDVESLPMFDIEFLFLNISAKSNGEIVDYIIKCGKCEHENPYSLNLLDVTVPVQDSKNNTIKLSDTIGVVMKYPTINVSDLVQNAENKTEATNDVIISCIDYVYDSESVFYPKDYTREELVEYIESFTDENLSKINAWFKSIPEVTTVAKFKCKKCDHDNEYEIKGIKNFL
jgi:hypothetical protein